MKKVLGLMLVAMMILSMFVGCGEEKPADTGKAVVAGEDKAGTEDDAGTGTEDSNEKMEEVVLTIPHYKAGQNVGGKFFLPQVERFNAKYDGQYEIVIEEVPQDSYLEKIKQLAQQKKLPALIEGADKEWFEDIAIANGLYQDLSPMIDANPDIKSSLIADSVEFNTQNGDIVSMPSVVVRPIGMFYNTTLIDPPKLIGEMSVDEFGQMMEDNDQKLAFMTAENAWTTSLFFTAIIAEQDGGIQILKDGVNNYITDYTTDFWVEAFTKLQYFLETNGSSNTLGAAYADAANSFMSASSAVIANGPWMVGDFSAESTDKWSNGFTGDDVMPAVLPGNAAIATFTGYNWWIPSGLEDGEVAAAMAFLAFINTADEVEAFMLAEGGLAPNLDKSDAFIEELAKNRILSEIDKSVTADTLFVPRSTDVMPPSVNNEDFGKILPKLIDGSMTPLEFGEAISSKAMEAME